MPLRTYVDILETYPNSCHKIDMIIDRRSDSLYKYRKRELVTQRHILRRFQRDVGDGCLVVVVALPWSETYGWCQCHISRTDYVV